MTGKAPWARVVIVNYNCRTWLQAAVDSLAAQTLAEFEAVIVDNGSGDGSMESLRLPDDRFRVILAGANLGFAAGCNLGAQGCAAPWLAMLNPDAMAEPQWLERLREAAARHPGAASFGSTQIMADDPTRLDGGGDNYSIYGIAWRGGHGGPVRTDCDRRVVSACGAAALYRRDAFEAAGGFEDGFHCYLEDVDLGLRLRLAGHEVVQVADAVVRHVGSASSGRASPFTRRSSARNGVWLMLRCLPAPLLALAVPLHLVAMAWLMARRPAEAPARLQGLLQALPGLATAWRQRRRIQAGRVAGAMEAAAWLAWNPLTVMGRRVMDLPPSRNRLGRVIW